MNSLARLINSIVFQTDSSGMLTDSDSETESEVEQRCLSIGEFMNNLYTQENDQKEHELSEEEHSELSDSDSYSDPEYHRPRLVSLEGNIGAGKSTIIDTLKQKYANDPRFVFVDEPVQLWEQICDKSGKNMIQKYYENPKRYAFAFQIMAFQTRLQLLKEAMDYAEDHEAVTTIIMERSLDADYHIFAKMLSEEGLMDEVEYEIYVQMSTNVLKEYGVDGIIWLDTDYEECFRRIVKRAREGEEAIEMRYLRKCSEYHVEWLGADMGFVCRINGMDIDLGKIDKYLV
jgi:deoxyadenosine/deoxycytidine kinase